MSEEEIIKEIKERINCNEDSDCNYCPCTVREECLLELYNKEKEEKEKFKKALGKRITYCNELEKDLFENCSNYVISKDKIREKIKKLENEFHFYAGRDPYEWDDSEFDGDRCDDIALQIRVLKELLEEGE